MIYFQQLIKVLHHQVQKQMSNLDVHCHLLELFLYFIPIKIFITLQLIRIIQNLKIKIYHSNSVSIKMSMSIKILKKSSRKLS
jgi:hypothetical protein